MDQGYRRYRDTQEKGESFLTSLGNAIVQKEHDENVSGAKANVNAWEDILANIPGLSTSAYDAYVSAADKLNSTNYFNEQKPFSYDKEISDFMNPNTNTIVNKAGESTQRANPLRSGYGLDVDRATSMENAYNDLWNEAKNDWTTDREYERNIWKDSNDLAQSQLDYQKAQAQGNLDVMKQLADWENARNNQYMSTIAEYQRAMAETLANNNLTWADLGGNPLTSKTSGNANTTGI